MPKHDRDDSDLSDSSDELLEHAKLIARAEFKAERQAKKLKDELNAFHKAKNAEKRSKATQLKNMEKAKLWAKEEMAKERAKKTKLEREKAYDEALEQRPFGFTRAMRSYSDSSNVSSLDSQVFILFLFYFLFIN
jgi:hypothetical protein